MRPAATQHDRSPRQPDRSEITGHKGSIFYRAHSYHTKVPPEGIARLIQHYTEPGDTVLDSFCGSGMTGVAARMTGRHAVLSDLSPAAVHIARGYAATINPGDIQYRARTLLEGLAGLEEELYGTACPTCGHPGRVEYTVWSDVYRCPACHRDLLFWDAALDHTTGQIAREVACRCGGAWPKRALTWLRSEPVLQSVSCRQCGRAERKVSGAERDHILRFDRSAIRSWYPTTPFERWREMWRGQHGEQRIETAADFFTPRNLRALADTWASVNAEPDEMVRQGMRFAFTAAVNRASRRYQWNPKRPTNVLSSTMYIASLSYEFNVFSLVRRKMRSMIDLYREMQAFPGSTTVHQGPAQALQHVPDGSVDYVFTDPPFGSNIFYADSSFLWEAWLGQATDTELEAVVHQSQRAEHGGKSVQDYEKLMADAFAEITRVLRPNCWASVMFHNSSDEVWSALQRALETAGFQVSAAVAFDKSQPSFKGLKGRLIGERVPSFDLVLHMQRRAQAKPVKPTEPQSVSSQIRSCLATHVREASPSRRTTPYLHSLVMRMLIEEGLPIAGYSYRAVEDLCSEIFELKDGHWSMRDSERRPD
jgi:DNA modification methylase